jgi:hypothetical protein
LTTFGFDRFVGKGDALLLLLGGGDGDTSGSNASSACAAVGFRPGSGRCDVDDVDADRFLANLGEVVLVKDSVAAPTASLVLSKSSSSSALDDGWRPVDRKEEEGDGAMMNRRLPKQLDNGWRTL